MSVIKQRYCLLLFIIVWSCAGILFTDAQLHNDEKLHPDEVEALKEIAEQLGKKDWNFSVDPCSNHTVWKTPKSDAMPLYNNTVNCTCYEGICHVIHIFLRGQDLDGVLPPSVAKLPYLKAIDFTRNYLQGNIPREWATMKNLTYLAVTVNNLVGPIPTYLGNITSLVYVSLESNMFSGTVPPELGKLVNLVNLILNTNNLTGQLPLALSNLTKLTELRISSNNFKGRMPNIFHYWPNLEKLEIQASGFEGPIPSTISTLHNLSELRISDLNGEQGSEFPALENMKNMWRLMLRSCNLHGTIPPYISQMTALQKLDLSFNRLEGYIPEDFKDLQKLDKIYLTSNFLDGSIPDWIKSETNEKLKADLSYNNFSEISAPTTCSGSLNLYRSFSSKYNSSLGSCINNTCQQDYYSLYINCGANVRTNIGKIEYEADPETDGVAKAVEYDNRPWGTSSTGEFWDISNEDYNKYIANNVSILRMNNSDLYANARLSALSLTYFARCLANGNYTVKLHFAEIIIRNNRSFHSLGRRIFDVYIQEVKVLEDFNIEREAGGVDKVVIREFKKVQVKNKILEIRFHWSGKGTAAAPRRGTYGPLISAISINSEFKPRHGVQTKTYIVVGIVVSVLCLIFTILGIFWWKGFFGRSTSREQELKGLDLQTGFFTFRQIKAATNNFDLTNKIGEGGFGSVYKGMLLDGSIIAVKQLSPKSRQGNREFVNEIGMISGLNHPNLVRLYGCCIEGNQLLLVYEYMENNSLARALFGPEDGRLKLDWSTRHKICVGIAKGLSFLHEESALRVVHRDIKTTNILLDRDLNPKISDFGLAKLDEEENTHISTRIAGTIGYMAPEYALWGYLTYKADVFSFGVVALEIVAGKSNMNYRPNENYVCLVDWALVLQQKGNLMELVDPNLGSDFNKEEAVRMIKIAILCTNPSPALRPTMSAVVSMLEGRTVVHDLIMDPSIYGDELRFTALREQFNHMAPRSSTELIQSANNLKESNPGSVTISGNDLYQINPESVTISGNDIYQINPESISNSSASYLTTSNYSS